MISRKTLATEMNTQKYLQLVLEQQSLSGESEEVKALRSERDNVEKFLRSHFKDSKPSIQYAGSYKKGTMIRDNYDLDVVCYFNHDDTSAGETLEEIFNNVKKALESGYHVEPKKSALRLESSDSDRARIYFHIDVVPGRFIDENQDDVFLYQSSGEKERLKTNLQKHIDHIKGSRLIDTIKLVKIWKERNGFREIKTFILELLVIKIAKDLKDSDGLDVCLKNFWEELRDNIDDIEIEDPANPTGNDLSDLFDDSIRDTISLLARKTLDFIESQGWEAIFGKSESVSDEEKIVAVQAAILQDSDRPVKPWCDIV